MKLATRSLASVAVLAGGLTLVLAAAGPALAGTRSPAVTGTPTPTPTPGVPSIAVAGPTPVAGGIVSFSGSGLTQGDARIVVIPRGVIPAVGVPAAPTAQRCYLGQPTALATADPTVPAGGILPSTATWNGALRGSYTALLLQGPCFVSSTKPSVAAATDNVVRASVDFDVLDGASVPALSGWGVAALVAALTAGGWAVLSRARS